MSPLESPAFVGLAFLASVLAATVLAIVAERRATVKRNRAARERGYVR